MEENKNTNAVGGKEEFGVKFINPQAILDKLEIVEGMLVADFGCGTGYFTFPVAKKVGQEGKVYALDILKEKLEAISSQAKLDGLSNIITKRVNLEKIGGSKLEDDSVDWVFLVNMLFQNKGKDRVIQEAKRVLKRGGKILVVEWNEKDSSLGPQRNLKISKDQLSELAGENELGVVEQLEISDFHFGMILAKYK